MVQAKFMVIRLVMKYYNFNMQQKVMLGLAWYCSCVMSDQYVLPFTTPDFISVQYYADTPKKSAVSEKLFVR